jgi:hypothetical protein
LQVTVATTKMLTKTPAKTLMMMTMMTVMTVTKYLPY